MLGIRDSQEMAGPRDSRDMPGPREVREMLGPRDSREMPPPGPRQDMPGYAQDGGYRQQRGRGRGGRMGGPGRSAGRVLMDEGPMYDHPGRLRDDTPLRGREPDFLEPILQDEGMEFGQGGGMGGGPGRGLSMRGGMRGQGRMGGYNLPRGGIMQGRGLGRGGRGRGGPMMPLDGPPFRPGMGPRGGPMDMGGPGGRFGGRGLGPGPGPGWAPRGGFLPHQGPPGTADCTPDQVSYAAAVHHL